MSQIRENYNNNWGQATDDNYEQSNSQDYHGYGTENYEYSKDNYENNGDTAQAQEQTLYSDEWGSYDEDTSHSYGYEGYEQSYDEQGHDQGAYEDHQAYTDDGQSIYSSSETGPQSQHSADAYHYYTSAKATQDSISYSSDGTEQYESLTTDSKGFPPTPAERGRGSFRGRGAFNASIPGRGAFSGQNRGGFQQSRSGPQQNRGGPNQSRGGFQQNTGGSQQNRGGFQQNRGGSQQQAAMGQLFTFFAHLGSQLSQQERGGSQPSRGGFQQKRGGFQQNRGGSQQNRGGSQQNRGRSQQSRGGSQQSRGGSQQNRGGSQQNRGRSQQSRGGFQQNKGSFSRTETSETGQFGVDPETMNEMEMKYNEGQFGMAMDSLSSGTDAVNKTSSGQFGAESQSPVKKPATSFSSRGTPEAKMRTSKPASSQQSDKEQQGTDGSASKPDSQLTSVSAGNQSTDNPMSESAAAQSLEPGTNQENDDAGDGEEEEEEDSSDEDTEFCKYCKLSFTTPKAYHSHTRGLQHTTLVMEAKSKKGHRHFQKEVVDASVLEVHIPPAREPEPERSADADLEDNWMNLDEDVLSYLKEKRNPENLDLNPEEVGKKPLPDDFHCALCNIKCTGAAAFRMHIEGKQHRNNLEAAKSGAKLKRKKQAAASVMVESKERSSKFSEMAKDTTSPMLGLEFVTEFQKTDMKAAARYVCNLCESKCDGSTVMPHVVGLKHRLRYLQAKRPAMYEHLTKYNSKKKKSEMNANLEDFAREIEDELGRGDVKVKIELENFEDEDELAEAMKRHSKALAEKVKELEEGKVGFDDEVPDLRKSRPIRPALGGPPDLREGRPVHPLHIGPSDAKRPRFADRDPHFERGPYHRQSYDNYPRSPYEDFNRPPPRRPIHEDHFDHYFRGRHSHDDFRASYRDRFDPYRGDDLLYERRMFEERRRLDDLMLDRHRLSDPYAERRRVDDIMMRRSYLDKLEKARLEDIMERRKRLQENDVDYLRLQRFANRETTPQTTGMSAEEKKRLDDLLARREALKSETQSRQEAVKSETQADLNKKEVQAIENRLAEHKSSDPAMAAEQERAAQALKEEAAKHPNINIAEVLGNLSGSMIASEDDAAMALQISNALTQALLKYRLQNATKELSSITDTLKPMFEKKAPEPTIPGLGPGTTAGSSSSAVPSFLRTLQDTAPSSYASPGQNYTSVAQDYGTQPQSYGVPGQSYSSLPQSTASASPVSQSVAQSGTAVSQYSGTGPSYVAQSYPAAGQSYPAAATTQQSNSSAALSYASLSQSFASSGQSSYYDNILAKASQGVKAIQSYTKSLAAQVSVTTGVTAAPPLPTGVPPPPPPPPPPASQTTTQTTIVDTSNVDQPQKLLLDSIRKQTELIKQKIAAKVQTSVPNTQKQTQSSTPPSTYPNPYLASTSAVSAAGNQASISQVTSTASQRTNVGQVTSASQSTSIPQYYRQKFKPIPPSSSPQVDMFASLTNDLPIRRKR